MMIGALLAVSSVWSALGTPDWAESIPSLFIGLSLVAVGYSLISRARRDARRRDEERDPY